MTYSDFEARWKPAGGAERANYGLFLQDLCDLIGVPRPDPTTDNPAQDAYVLERAVDFSDRTGSKKSTGRIDLYKRGCFVLETKQGTESPGAAEERQKRDRTDLGGAAEKRRKGHALRGTARWEQMMQAARQQALGYVRALPASEARPCLYWWPTWVIASMSTATLWAWAIRSCPFPTRIAPGYHWPNSPTRKHGTCSGSSSPTRASLIPAARPPASRANWRVIWPACRYNSNVRANREWPKDLAKQMQAVRDVLQQSGGPVSVAQVAAWFGKLRPATVQPLLDTLLALVLLRQTDEGAYVS